MCARLLQRRKVEAQLLGVGKSSRGARVRAVRKQARGRLRTMDQSDGMAQARAPSL